MVHTCNYSCLTELHQKFRTDLIAYILIRHQEFEQNKGKFRQSKVGKYESAWILEESEDLKANFKNWMARNRRVLSSAKAANFLNDVLLKALPGGVLQSYGIKLPVVDSTAWRWMKKCGAKSEAHKQGYYNDHHNCEDSIMDYRCATAMMLNNA